MYLYIPIYPIPIPIPTYTYTLYIPNTNTYCIPTYTVYTYTLLYIALVLVVVVALLEIYTAVEHAYNSFSLGIGKEFLKKVVFMVKRETDKKAVTKTQKLKTATFSKIARPTWYINNVLNSIFHISIATCLSLGYP